jgi:hypothetical protein
VGSSPTPGAHNQLTNNTYDYTINKKLNLEGEKAFKLDEGLRGGYSSFNLEDIPRVLAW